MSPIPGTGWRLAVPHRHFRQYPYRRGGVPAMCLPYSVTPS